MTLSLIFTDRMPVFQLMWSTIGILIGWQWGMPVEKEKFRLGKYKFQFGSGVGQGPGEEPLVGG